VIKIRIELDAAKTVKCITSEGHSAFSEKGKDIVCASVSTLIYSCYLALSEIIPDKVDLIDNKKKLKILLNNFYKINTAEIRGITIFLIKGLKLLEKSFKKNLKIIIKNIK